MEAKGGFWEESKAWVESEVVSPVIKEGKSTVSHIKEEAVESVIRPVGETAQNAAYLAQDTAKEAGKTVVEVTEGVANTANSALNSAEQLAKKAMGDVKNTAEVAIFEAEEAANAAEQAANYAEQAVGDKTYKVSLPCQLTSAAIHYCNSRTYELCIRIVSW